jgi:hypothetical protein
MKINAFIHKKTEGGFGNAFYIFFEKNIKCVSETTSRI